MSLTPDSPAPNAEPISALVVDSAYQIYRALGPGMLESVYERTLAHALERRGCRVDRQIPVDFQFEGQLFEGGFRVDLLVDRCVVVEVKSVDITSAVHIRQTLTYVRLLDLRLGILLNFGAPTFREVVRRVVNGYPGADR